MKQDFSLPPAPKRPLGEVNIWLASIGLSLGLIMIFGLLGIIVFNGLEAFWPKTIHELTLAPSSKEEQPLVLYAGITKDQTRHVPADPAHPGSTAKDVREYQLFTGSKESYGQSYRYVDAHNVTASATPKGLLCLERMEGGKALVKPLELKLASGETIPAASPEFMEAFRRVLDRETDLRDRVKTIDTRDIGSVNTRLADARRDIKAIERSYDIRKENGQRTAVPRKNPILTDMDDLAGELDRLRANEEQLNAEYARYTAEAAKLRAQQSRDSLVYALGDGEKKEIRMDKIVYGYQPNDLGFFGKCGIFLHNLYHFITDDPREANTEGGIFPAIFGTFIMTLLMSVLVTPVGVIGAIYLREYARQGTLVQAVRICVNNLAGVPSIVFGVFGLGFFVYYLGGSIDELFYWKKLAVDNTPTFGTSGCGKSTLLRNINRMNDLVPDVRHQGDIRIDGTSLYDPRVEVISLRKRVGMVFQKYNPFPKSIYENIVFPLRVAGRNRRAELDETVERSLKGAALWDEVKDKLHESAYGLSGGQQQRLCIARAIANRPQILLMDEPCAALDPIATLKIEDLMEDLKKELTIVIVTHNMQQATRIADRTAFMYMGRLVEYGETSQIFTNPTEKETEAYITGRFS